MARMSMPGRKEDKALPLYRRVKHHIIRRIANGDWPEGARIASEHALMSELGASRMTVHRAVRELAAEGLLRRVQGLGTFVNGPKPQSALLEIRDLRQEVEERGHRYGCDPLALTRRPADAEAADALEVPPGTEIYHSSLLHLEDGRPFALEERETNPAFAPGYIGQDFTRVTPFEYLEALGPLDAAEHIVEAARATARIRRLLDLSGGEPCLVISRRTWSRGMVVSRARTSFPGARYRLAGRQDFTAPRD
jgi:GntR family histidine utilization transcriptional repressor